MMATPNRPSTDLVALAARLAEDANIPAWEDASDLGRLHMQDFAIRSAHGFDILTSRGTLRLAGSGVTGHSVDMTAAGEFLTRWQALVTSTGAATEGKKSIKKIPEEIFRRTSLALSAAPMPGSLVLEFVPSADAGGERYPGGEAAMDGPAEPLVEKAVNVALDVLDLASSEDPLSLPEKLADLGPRVATKALELSELAASAQLDLDLTWEVSGKARRRSRSSARQLGQFAAVLRAERLDTEPAEFDGVLRTVSDRKKIDIEIDDESAPSGTRVISVSRGEVDFTPYRVGQSVHVVLAVRLAKKAGGGETRRYTAESVRPIDP